MTPPQSENLDLAIEATIRAASLDAINRGIGRATRLYIRPAHWRHKQRRTHAQPDSARG
jgi:hypothetical protein